MFRTAHDILCSKVENAFDRKKYRGMNTKGSLLNTVISTERDVFWSPYQVSLQLKHLS